MREQHADLRHEVLHEHVVHLVVLVVPFGHVEVQVPEEVFITNQVHPLPSTLGATISILSRCDSGPTKTVVIEPFLHTWLFGRKLDKVGVKNGNL